MATDRTIAIIGAGLAGAKAAEAARAQGFDGRLVLIGDERHLPYERPPLSKAVLRGEADPASTEVRPESFYADHDIELVTGRPSGLDAHRRELSFGYGRPLRFDRAVLATGARPRHLDVPGASLPGVHLLRTLDDALALRDALAVAGRAIVIGAGWIGSEVTASARQLGVDVTLVDPLPLPLHRVLGGTIGAMFRDLHAEHGVDLRLGVGVEAIAGRTAATGVRLTDGSSVDAEVVVVGVGVVPDVELAETAGLAVHDGVTVDAHLRSSVPHVFAAGDVASAWSERYGRHLRVEHWATALHQGGAAGANAAGAAELYGRIPSFFSDQYDLGLEYVGLAGADDDLVIRGDLAARELVALWHHDGQVNAAMNVNVWGVGDHLRTIVESGRRVAPGLLTDAGPSLEELAALAGAPGRGRGAAGTAGQPSVSGVS